MHPLKLMVSVGEASADVHVSNALRALALPPSSLQCFGMGGPKLAEWGMRIDLDSREISVMGIFEVLRRYRHLLRCLNRLRDLLRRERPDLLLLADNPNFNLKLAETARELGIPVLYFISPKIWAWREGRLQRIGELVSMMAVIFPFETRYYEKAGIPVRYVGNPVVDEVNQQPLDGQLRQQLGLSDEQKLVALLPGSRHSELGKLLPVMLDSARELVAQAPECAFVLPLANTFAPAQVQALIDAHPDAPTVHLLSGQTHSAMRAADVAIAASGTATLEVALHNTPMVVIYRVHALTYAIVKPLLKIAHVCLVNIVAGREVVPELLQKHANPKRIAREALHLLRHPQAQAEGLKEVREKLGPPGSSRRVAQLIQEMLPQSSVSE